MGLAIRYVSTSDNSQEMRRQSVSTDQFGLGENGAQEFREIRSGSSVSRFVIKPRRVVDETQNAKIVMRRATHLILEIKGWCT